MTWREKLGTATCVIAATLVPIGGGLSIAQSVNSVTTVPADDPAAIIPSDDAVAGMAMGTEVARTIQDKLQ